MNTCTHASSIEHYCIVDEKQFYSTLGLSIWIILCLIIADFDAGYKTYIFSYKSPGLK